MHEEVRVIIVEDADDKAVAVEQKLTAISFGVPLVFTRCSNLVGAVQLLQEHFFNVLILDLKIPALDRDPTTENSRSLLDQLRSGKLIAPSCIVGLTAFDDAMSSEANYFAENMFTIAKYNPFDDDWVEVIAQRIRFTLRWAKSLLRAASFTYHSDIVIVTARYENEYVPVRRKIRWKSGPSHDNSYFEDCQVERGTALFGGKTLSVILFCVGEMGIAASAACASHIIACYRPRCIIMLGMCCGFNHPTAPIKCRLGDVIIARDSACWDEGRYEERDDHEFFANRALPRSIHADLDALIMTMLETEMTEFHRTMRPLWMSAASTKLRTSFGLSEDLPSVRRGLIVSGSSVIALQAIGEEVTRRFPTSLGFEMELYGVYSAVARAAGVKPAVFGIKGVADFGDGAKKKEFQGLASQMAYSVATLIIERVFRTGA